MAGTKNLMFYVLEDVIDAVKWSALSDPLTADQRDQAGCQLWDSLLVSWIGCATPPVAAMT